ncbi:hypothetical protein OIO90_004005 [Microbotryomycetes sp. JL221]|nr:hypothetical protein OIO90_004005 [Microbotryomycetes sp. JL221]
MQHDAVVVVPKFTLRRPMSTESIATTTTSPLSSTASSLYSNSPKQPPSPYLTRPHDPPSSPRRRHLRTSSSNSSLRSTKSAHGPTLSQEPPTFHPMPKRRSSYSNVRTTTTGGSSIGWLNHSTRSAPTLAELVQDEEQQQKQHEQLITRLTASGSGSGSGSGSDLWLPPPPTTTTTTTTTRTPHGDTLRQRTSFTTARHQTNNEDMLSPSTSSTSPSPNYSPYFEQAFTSEPNHHNNKEDWDAVWAQHQRDRLVPESAVLYPPLYGRPGPSPSPDIFATLLQPILSLSRPSSPGVSPSLSAVDATTSPVLTTKSQSHVDLTQQLQHQQQQLQQQQQTQTPADRSASSLPAHFPPRGENDPAPTVESQGFVLYIGSLVAWFCFLIWSLLKDEWLMWLGIEWYPSREWALLVPAWTVMLVVFIYITYLSINIFHTPNLNSLNTLTDDTANVLSFNSSTNSNRSSQYNLNTKQDSIKHVESSLTTEILESNHPLLVNSILLPEDAVPTLHDLPIGLVNRVTFGDFRRRNLKGTTRIETVSHDWTSHGKKEISKEFGKQSETNSDLKTPVKG